MRKVVAGAGLALIIFFLGYALFSFWRENWSATKEPGALERLLARWLLSSSRAAENEIPNPFPPTEANLAAGRELYEAQCSFCHGVAGDGSSASGVQFYPPVPSLVEANRNLTEAQMHAVIRLGVRYTGMPSFAKALNDEQIWKIVGWVRQLPESRPSGSANR